ncbi:MAG: thioredoxin-disulfide reductase [Lachnospiraceae bacterium]|nr:thioredoxin-disulfide reductase [Lachnospiraceae bacterium]
MTDIIIVGAGTAGLSAAIYALRAGKSVIVFEQLTYGGQIINTPEVENYPGIKSISGFDFATGLYEQATALGAVIESAQVEAVEDGEVKKVTAGGKVYEAKAVILATGAKNRPLGLEREEELTGSGVSYCATCDGAFYKNRAVAVSGGGNTALEDALFLSNYCSKVYLVHRRDAFRGEVKLAERLKEKENVEFVLNANIIKILGENEVSGVVVKDKISGEEKELAVEGLFIAIGQMPDNQAFSSIVKLDEKGYIIAGEDCETGTAGIYAAGDCRTKTVRQLTTAAADGAVAALAACAYCELA